MKTYQFGMDLTNWTHRLERSDTSPVPALATLSEPANEPSTWDQSQGGCRENSFELVMIALTLPLWTFITIYIILLLIHWARLKQYFSLYDKCTTRNAHFKYDFHLIIGKHSINYNRNEFVILDLLDNHTISTMSVQIPGSTVFNQTQMFMYRHSRPHLRCVQFTVYRRHPIKDVKSIRVAHSCSNPDSRLYIYGLDLHDDTNSENKFFPIMSVVRYRGTQWALATTFEPKQDVDFKRLGVECHDPFGYSNWPIYLELLTILLYVWCASFCFGHLISIKSISGSVPLHTLTILSIVATSTLVLSAIYLRFIKTHIVNGHYESYSWHSAAVLYLLSVMGVSIGFWTLALNQSLECRPASYDWLCSTCTCAAASTGLILVGWWIAACKRSAKDSVALLETDTNLAKTNSKEGIQFVNDPTQNICASFLTNQETSSARRTTDVARLVPNKVVVMKTSLKSTERKGRTSLSASAKKNERQTDAATKRTDDNETLDTAYNQGSKHMKVKNRNSISQYV